MSEPGKPQQNDSVREIEEEIERTREQLTDTVEALAYKADVPTRAKERAIAVKERAAEKATHARHVAAEKATQAKNRASETATHSAHVARQKADGAVHTAQESPPRTRAAIGAGVAAFAAAVVSVWYVVRRRRS